jgi:hypothetical protein
MTIVRDNRRRKSSGYGLWILKRTIGEAVITIGDDRRCLGVGDRGWRLYEEMIT